MIADPLLVTLVKPNAAFWKRQASHGDGCGSVEHAGKLGSRHALSSLQFSHCNVSYVNEPDVWAADMLDISLLVGVDLHTKQRLAGSLQVRCSLDLPHCDRRSFCAGARCREPDGHSAEALPPWPPTGILWALCSKEERLSAGSCPGREIPLRSPWVFDVGNHARDLKKWMRVGDIWRSWHDSCKVRTFKMEKASPIYCIDRWRCEMSCEIKDY